MHKKEGAYKRNHNSEWMSNIGASMYGPSSNVWIGSFIHRIVHKCMDEPIHTSEDGPYIRWAPMWVFFSLMMCRLMAAIIPSPKKGVK